MYSWYGKINGGVCTYVSIIYVNIDIPHIQYGEAKLIPFMYTKGINFASPYCTNFVSSSLQEQISAKYVKMDENDK